MSISVYPLAREATTNRTFRRVGRHKRTGEFYWYTNLYGRFLRSRKLLRGVIGKDEEEAFLEWARENGLEGKTKPAETKREAIVRLATAEAGTVEVPAGSNTGPRVRWYQRATTLRGSGWPWCAAFCVRMALEAGYRLPRAARSASVWAITEWARASHRLVRRAPLPGDWVVLLGEGRHIGIVVSVHRDGSISTLEGNTSSSSAGSQDNGGGVWPKRRSASDVVHVISLEGL